MVDYTNIDEYELHKDYYDYRGIDKAWEIIIVLFIIDIFTNMLFSFSPDTEQIVTVSDLPYVSNIIIEYIKMIFG